MSSLPQQRGQWIDVAKLHLCSAHLKLQLPYSCIVCWLNTIYVSVQLGMYGCSLWFVDSSPCKQALTLGVSMEKNNDVAIGPAGSTSIGMTRMRILRPHLALTYPNHCPTSCRTNSHFEKQWQMCTFTPYTSAKPFVPSESINYTRKIAIFFINERRQH